MIVKMSGTNEKAVETVADDDERCASCGTAGGGEGVTLKNCTACYLVKYCGVECQRNHWPEHKRACKKRAAELKDELLFKQPESTHLGDCPICLLPLPLVTSQYAAYSCCSKLVCNGCSHANTQREMGARLTPSCPFCRHPMPATDAEENLLTMKRVQANDAVALHIVGMEHFKAGDYAAAIEYLERAAVLGYIQSNGQLAQMYHNGHGCEKDLKKFIYHLEKAAIGGHPAARQSLGAVEERKGNFDRAVKHVIIAANLGHDESLKQLKKGYSHGLVSKEDFAAALRAHKAAVDATKSPQRNEAEAARKAGRFM